MGKYWRFLRIENQGKPNHLCCSGIEFYGDLIDNKDMVGQADQPQIQHQPLVKAAEGNFKYSGSARGIEIDQNGLLYAIGTGFGSHGWKNPYTSGQVNINFSHDGCNFYSTNGGHKVGDVA